MKDFIAGWLAAMDEHRHLLAIVVISLICAAAVWAMLLVWTQ